MALAPFVGREAELDELRLLWQKKVASLIVIQGRRRIGKSRLVREFGGDKQLFYLFSGIPLTPATTAQSQRDVFANQLVTQFNLPGLQANDWSDLFNLISTQTQNKPTLILLDEISWMGSKDPDFLGKLKNAWDLSFSQNPELMLIICGSVSSWIEKNILNDTGFVGRISSTLILRELPLENCSQLLTQLGNKLSVYDTFKLLSVTGGIPKYLEEVLPKLSADDNIKRLCFMEGGLLYNEFDKIFSDLFSKRSTTYKSIVEALFDGPMEYGHICKALQIGKSGQMSDYLNDLLKGKALFGVITAGI